MDTDKFLKYFSLVANVSLNQTKELFELCDNDFEILMEVQAKRKKNNVWYCPGDKEALQEVLNLEL